MAILSFIVVLKLTSKFEAVYIIVMVLFGDQVFSVVKAIKLFGSTYDVCFCRQKPASPLGTPSRRLDDKNSALYAF